MGGTAVWRGRGRRRLYVNSPNLRPQIDPQLQSRMKLMMLGVAPENPIHVTVDFHLRSATLHSSQFIQLPLSTTTKAAAAASAALPLPSLPSALPNPTVPPTGLSSC